MGIDAANRIGPGAAPFTSGAISGPVAPQSTDFGGRSAGNTTRAQGSSFQSVFSKVLSDFQQLEASWQATRNDIGQGLGQGIGQGLGSVSSQGQAFLKLQLLSQELGLKSQLASQVVESITGAVKKLQQAGQG